MIQMCSGIPHGRVLDVERYAQRFQKLICLHLLILVNIPVEGIRLLDAVCLLLGKRRRVPFAAVWSQPGVVCSEKVMFDPLTR